MLRNTIQLRRQWTHAVEWLQDELDRHRGTGGQYNYNSWSPPAQSNDSTNSFVLERSQSAKNILQMAFEICPDEDNCDKNEKEKKLSAENHLEIQSSYDNIESTKNESNPKQQILAVQIDGGLCSSPSATSVKNHMCKINHKAEQFFDQSNSEEYAKTSHNVDSNVTTSGSEQATTDPTSEQA